MWTSTPPGSTRQPVASSDPGTRGVDATDGRDAAVLHQHVGVPAAAGDDDLAPGHHHELRAQAALISSHAFAIGMRCGLERSTCVVGSAMVVGSSRPNAVTRFGSTCVRSTFVLACP